MMWNFLVLSEIRVIHHLEAESSSVFHHHDHIVGPSLTIMMDFGVGCARAKKKEISTKKMGVSTKIIILREDFVTKLIWSCDLVKFYEILWQ